MGPMEAWLNATVREGFELGRSLAEIAEESMCSTAI